MIVEALLPSPDCGRFLVLVFLARVVGLCFFGGYVLFGLLPVPIFIGEVLSVFFFSWLWLRSSFSCILWLGVALW